MNNRHHYLLSVVASIITLLSYPVTTAIAQSNNHDYYYHTGPISDPNDPTHIKAQQLLTDNPLMAYHGSDKCDKGKGYPLCYNVGYYLGVIDANSYNVEPHGGGNGVGYHLGCSSNIANYCAGYVQGIVIHLPAI